MITCSDDIYIYLSGDIYIIWTSRNGIFFAKPRRRKGTVIFCVVFCFYFVCFSRSFLNKEATLLAIPSLLRRADTLVPGSSGENFEYS